MDGLMLAYGTKANSTCQQEYAARRVAQLAELRKQHRRHPALVSTTNHLLDGSGDPGEELRIEDMAGTSRLASHSVGQTVEYQGSLFANLYELRHGRRFLRDLSYPLPVDLPEIHRQNLRTLLACRAFGRVACSVRKEDDVPRKVLDVGCGSGYWSATCHDYFSSLGHNDVSFTGLDYAPLAPNLNEQGLDWKFVRHDVRRCPLPFEDGEFDLVVCKDLSLAVSIGSVRQTLIDDCVRVLRIGGTLEMWDADHVVRSLAPHPSPPPDTHPNDLDQAAKTGTYILSPDTVFSPSRNKYLQQANSWILEGLEARRLLALPCARTARDMFRQTPLVMISTRRVAIPLREYRWEADASSRLVSKWRGRLPDEVTLADQAALRQTALMTVLHEIESLEVMIREVNGKNPEEWSHWWSSMMSDLSNPSKGALSGECLEIGAWWAIKQEPRR